MRPFTILFTIALLASVVMFVVALLKFAWGIGYGISDFTAVFVTFGLMMANIGYLLRDDDKK